MSDAKTIPQLAQQVSLSVDYALSSIEEDLRLEIAKAELAADTSVASLKRILEKVQTRRSAAIGLTMAA
jgi:hypothetical protein